MRLGFFVGFLAGAAVASVLTQMHEDEAEKQSAVATEQTSGGPLDKLRQKVRDAMAAAREASDEKEIEMLRKYEEDRDH